MAIIVSIQDLAKIMTGGNNKETNRTPSYSPVELPQRLQEIIKTGREKYISSPFASGRITALLDTVHQAREVIVQANPISPETLRSGQHLIQIESWSDHIGEQGQRMFQPHYEVKDGYILRVDNNGAWVSYEHYPGRIYQTFISPEDLKYFTVKGQRPEIEERLEDVRAKVRGLNTKMDRKLGELIGDRIDNPVYPYSRISLRNNPIANAIKAARKGDVPTTATELLEARGLLSPSHQGRILAEAQRNTRKI